MTYRNPDWTTAASSANSNTVLYAGRSFDSLTSLYYNRARYYDPGLERFISRDPAAFDAGDANLYRYVGNAVTGYTDPYGLDRQRDQQEARELYAKAAELRANGQTDLADAYEEAARQRLADAFNQHPDANVFASWQRQMEQRAANPNAAERLVHGAGRTIEFVVDPVEKIAPLVGTSKEELLDAVSVMRYEHRRERYYRDLEAWFGPKAAQAARRSGFNPRLDPHRGIDAFFMDSAAQCALFESARLGVNGARWLSRTPFCLDESGTLRLPGEFDPKEVLTGERHHAISAKIARALDKHLTLKGKFQYRDPRFATTAIDRASHEGYSKFFRDLDDEVIGWINDPLHEAATEEEFVEWLRRRYSQPDLKAIFPKPS